MAEVKAMPEVKVDGTMVHVLQNRLVESMSQTRQMYLGDYGILNTTDLDSQSVKIAVKISNEYQHVRNMPPPTAPGKSTKPPVPEFKDAKVQVEEEANKNSDMLIEKVAAEDTGERAEKRRKLAGALVPFEEKALKKIPSQFRSHSAELILRKRSQRMVKPEWHAPWKCYRVIQGHLGWVRCMATDPANEFFVTGSNDRTIKIWDLASGQLRLTLTGHISAVMGLAVSPRSPYLFSCGQDKTVKCWDLEVNKVIRSYHGHLSGVYSLALHPTLDVLVTGGRDSVARVWDIRTKSQVRVLAGHKNTVAAVATQSVNPQVLTGSHDGTLRAWDLASGDCMATLTNHKKSVRSITIHPTEFTMASCSPDNVKVWKFPECKFMRNLSGHNAIINSSCINSENVFVTGADNGSIRFWDWKSGYCFQDTASVVQPGSMESENGIFECGFDVTGTRLITCEADKTIKMWKEDDAATEETHPIEKNWRPKKRKRY